MEGSAAAGLARFLHRIGQLKFVPRSGWLDRGVPAAETESVAGHSFRMAILAWLAALDAGAGHDAGHRLDADRVLKLALVHDLAEALAGDATPYDPAAVPASDDPAARHAFLQQRHVRDQARATAKHQAEAAAMRDLLTDLAPVPAAELGALWDEYQAQISAEARFVKQADRLETYLQSREYLADDGRRPMASFAAEVAETIIDPSLQRLRDAISSRGQDMGDR